jgi:FMN phosphatase YigB (HAD superfamily)
MHSAKPVVLLDVDNTLLDNDAIIEDLMTHIEEKFGADKRAAYHDILEELRAELGFVDYLGALQRFRLLDIDDPRMLLLSSFLVDYPFRKRLFPGALEVIAKLAEVSTPVILSDGDVVFQPRKIQKSGIWDAVEGRVLIFVHKEEKLDVMRRHFAASHYVMIDDKVRILHAMKDVMGDTLTTVFPRQGHYAFDQKEVARHPAPDLTVEHIGDLLDPFVFSRLMSALEPSSEKEMP